MAEGLVPQCEGCASSGPESEASRRRYLLRAGGGRTLGPMGRHGVLEQLGRGAVEPAHEVSILGGSWATLAAHPDFRALFLPGAEFMNEAAAAQKAEKGRWRWYDLRKRVRVLWVMGLAAVSIGLAFLSSRHGDGLVVPQGWLDSLSAWFVEVQEDGVATGEGAGPLTDEAMMAHLPGNELIGQIQARYPDAEGPPHGWIAQGRYRLWKGDEASVEVARVELEQAVAVAPLDVEAITALAEVYAQLLGTDPELAAPMHTLLYRASVLDGDSDSVAWLRASAWAAIAEGKSAEALEYARPCGEPVTDAGLPDTGVDLGCALCIAMVEGDSEDMAILGARFEEVQSVQLLWALAARSEGDLLLAGEIADRMPIQWPQSTWPTRIRLSVAKATGDWEAAITEAERLPKDNVDLAAEQAQLAEILLKSLDDPARGNEAYRELLNRPGMESLLQDPSVIADAASAAFYAWEWRQDPAELVRAGKLAGSALRFGPGHPAASLVQAQVQMVNSRPEAAIATLGAADTSNMRPPQRGRYAVKASLILVEANRANSALQELENARYRGGVSRDLYRAEAWAHLALDDPSAAMDSIEQIAFVDGVVEAAQSPIQTVWYPPIQWTALQGALSEALAGQLGYVEQERSAQGILLWSMGDPEGQLLITEEVHSERPRRASLAAGAQIAAQEGRFNVASALATDATLPHGSEPLLLAIRGRALCLRGDIEGGTDLLAAAISTTIQVGAWYRMQVACQLSAGDMEAALISANSWALAEPHNLGAVKTRLDLMASIR